MRLAPLAPLGLLAGLLLLTCQSDSAPRPATVPEPSPAASSSPAAGTEELHTLPLAFKGMELYSWLDERGEWAFDVTFGTNRRKFLDEVKSKPLTLAQVRERIAELPELESLTWTADVAGKDGEIVSLPFPPAAIVDELVAVARAKGVRIGGGPVPEGE